MVKTVALVLAGLAAGFAVAFMLQPSAPAVDASTDAVGATPAVTQSSTTVASAARVTALEDALAAEVEQRGLLEARIGELAAQVEELRASAARAPDSRGAEAQGSFEAARAELLRERVRNAGALQADELERRQIERLVAAGFAPDRAEWINRRKEELSMQALQAEYEALREGRRFDAEIALAGERTLRSEVGDADYERYLTALGLPASVAVRDVLASSPAERAGLRAGDEVVAYDGQRVFNVADINAMTLEGTAGESVVVEVRRDGQNLQLVMPRGPLGITGGGQPRGPMLSRGRVGGR